MEDFEVDLGNSYKLAQAPEVPKKFSGCLDLTRAGLEYLSFNLRSEQYG
jgi:hypothetical protein